MTSMTSEAPRAALDIWKRANLPLGVSKEENKIDIAKIQVVKGESLSDRLNHSPV